MEIKKAASALAGMLLAMLILVMPVLAQADQALTLRLSRDFGFSSGTGRIQGAFSLIASGPEDLHRVTYKIDDQVIGEVSESPFRLRFSTSDYPLGVHTLTATGETSAGSLLESNTIRVDFVSAEEGWQTGAKIALPILAIVFGVMLLGFVLPVLIGRGKRAQLPAGARRSYGMLGGGVCPKCKRPFAMHVYGLNMITGKLDRCPYCGRWSLVRRRSLEELYKAEAAELEAEQGAPRLPDDSEEEYRKQVDDSRYL
jgi:hypothetical protein